MDSLGAHRRVVTIDGRGYGRQRIPSIATSPSRTARTRRRGPRSSRHQRAGRLGGQCVGWPHGMTFAAGQPHRVPQSGDYRRTTDAGRRSATLDSDLSAGGALSPHRPEPCHHQGALRCVTRFRGDHGASDRAADIVRAFTEADRDSIRRTIRFMHRWRPLTDTLPRVTAPSLFLTGDLDDQHWRPADAQAAAATIPTLK